jgi:hypothetical protein
VAFKNNQFTLNSFIDPVFKDLNKSQQKQLAKASGVVKRQTKKNIKALGLVDEGNLLKGVKDDKCGSFVLVGMAAPAFHALIVEYGHAVVLPDGYKQKNPKALKVVPGEPYMLPAFQMTTSKVIDIMLEEW